MQTTCLGSRGTCILPRLQARQRCPIAVAPFNERDAFLATRSAHCRQGRPSLNAATWQPRGNHVSKPRSTSASTPPAVDGGDGGNGLPPLGGGGNNGDSGGGDEGSGKDGPSTLPAGKTVDNLPADLQTAFLEGKVPQVYIDRYFQMQANVFLAFLMSFGGLRERLLADPSFLIKMGIECGIGIVTKSAAELNKRGDNFYKELDFVAANIVMAIIADYMLCYLPAPTLAFTPKKQVSQNALQRFLSSCPENAFQKVPYGYAPFSVAQRFGAVLRNGTKLLGVGFGASLLGVGMTNALIMARQMLDPTWAPLNQPQNVLVMSAAYASYMATSSNLRYQILAGIIEERGIETIFKNYPAVCAVLSFVMRTSNTFLGSLMWVDYIRLIGVQKSG